MNSQITLNVLIILAMPVAAVAQATRSVWDGVYSRKQADRGKAAYSEQCVSCHGAALGGGEETPALTGDTFVSNWRNHSVDELFERVRTSMPPGRPGTLSRQTNADILAYIFAANEFPAGSAELGTQSEELKQIRFQTPGTPGPQTQTASTGAAPAVTPSASN